MTDLKLVVLDLDGTLLNSDKRVAASDLAAVGWLLSEGVMVAFATARDCASIYQKLPLHLPGLYHLGSGGALIAEAATEALVWASCLPSTLVAEAVTYLRGFGQPVFLNDWNDYWVDRENARVQMIRERYNLETRPFRAVDEVEGRIMRVSLAAPKDVLIEATLGAQAKFAGRLNVSLASADWLDLLAPNAGKGPALSVLQHVLGVSPEQTMAIGDYDSDLALYAYARYRVAMGNAVPAMKAAATYVTTTNDECGVAQAIRHYMCPRSLI